MPPKKRLSQGKRQALARMRKKNEINYATSNKKEEERNGNFRKDVFAIKSGRFVIDSESGKWFVEMELENTDIPLNMIPRFSPDELREKFPQLKGMNDSEIQEEIKKIFNTI